MKFIIIFFVCIPFVYSGFHSFMTTYTGIRGETGGIPEFSAVTTLDGRQIDYYDSEIKKLIPRQDWMKEFTSTETWNHDTFIRQGVQQTYKNNIVVLMQRFNQTTGVHTYQRMYGCEWDDQTEDSNGFDQYGYDGEDYATLDVKKLRYFTPVPQGFITTHKWNNNTAQLEFLKQYYEYECVYWLKYFLTLRKVDLERRAPEVSLLQKDPSSPVVCHATGFYPSAVTITWLRNGQDHDEDVDLGEILPNEDGTFQRTSTLIIRPDEWKNQYVCVVEHMTGTIRKILREDEIKSNNRPTEVYFKALVFAGVAIVLVICTLVRKILLYDDGNVLGNDTSIQGNQSRQSIKMISKHTSTKIFEECPTVVCTDPRFQSNQESSGCGRSDDF